MNQLLVPGHCAKTLPNVVVEWLTPLLRIREVPGSNPGTETGYPDEGFSWLSSVPPGKFQDSNFKLVHDRFLPHPLQFIIHISSFIPSYIVCVTEKASLNKLCKEMFSTTPPLQCHATYGYRLVNHLSHSDSIFERSLVQNSSQVRAMLIEVCSDLSSGIYCRVK
jgi:hypothetical protein